MSMSSKTANTRSFVNGNHGDGEHFFSVADFMSMSSLQKRQKPKLGEYNMLAKLTRMLF